jgi:hypothetical protein
MLCTSCSRALQPIVAVDIDGTLGNYYHQFEQFAALYLGESVPLNYDGSVEYSEYLGLEKQLYRDIKLAYRQGAQKRSMPVFNGAMTFMYELKHTAGAEIWIATTRPYLRLDNIDPDTRHWLERHHIPYDHIIYGEEKYDMLGDQVDDGRVVGVIEDLLEQCVAAEMKFGDVVLQPQRSHNRGARYKRTFDTFDEALQIIVARTDEWRSR